MDIYDYLNTFTDLSNVHITVWELNKEQTLYDSDKDEEQATIGNVNVPYELSCNEVSSADLFIGSDGRICLELNIETEEV